MTQQKYPIGGYAPGGYMCNCITCGVQFMGDKRAFQCEPCAVADRDRYDALTDEEKAEHDKRFREAIDEVYKQFNAILKKEP